MLIELPYIIGEQVIFVPDDAEAEDDARNAYVVENAMPDASEIEIHIDGEPKPRCVPVNHVIRFINRFTSSDAWSDG